MSSLAAATAAILSRTRVNNSLVQFVRMVIVSGIAAAVDLGILLAWVHADPDAYLTAAAAGFCIGLIVNYVLTVLWVFDHARAITKEFPLFAAIGIAGLGWNQLIIWTGVAHFSASPLAAKIISLVVVFFWNFLLRKRFVFLQ